MLDNRRIRIRPSDQWIRIRIQEAQKHMDPTDPDPQHWRKPLKNKAGVTYHGTGFPKVCEAAASENEAAGVAAPSNGGSSLRATAIPTQSRAFLTNKKTKFTLAKWQKLSGFGKELLKKPIGEAYG